MCSLSTNIVENMNIVLVEHQALQVLALTLTFNVRLIVSLMYCLTFIHSSSSDIVNNDDEVLVGAPG